MVALWRDISEALDLKPGKAEEIALNKMNNPKECMREVLSEWLHGNGKQPTTWQTILEALQDDAVARPELADKLRKKIIAKAQGIC